MRTLPYVLLAGLLTLSLGCETTDVGESGPFEAYEHLRPTWSPDGMSVAFTARIDGILGIYAVDTSGANLRRIHDGDALGLSWSPDGQSIAYSQSNLIYRVPVTLDNPTLIVPVAPSIRPSWSPDGGRVAYIRNGLRVVELATGLDTELYPYGTYPSWRPDGNAVMIYEVQSDGATGGVRFDVFLIDPTTLNRSDIHSLATFDDCGFFVMSPDGQHLYFSRKPIGALSQIRRVSVGSGTEIGLTSDGGDYPAVSADGEWIVYTRTAQDDGGLWLMRKDGTAKRRLTTP